MKQGSHCYSHRGHLLPGQLASGRDSRATGCGNRNSKLHQKWQPLPMKAEQTP